MAPTSTATISAGCASTWRSGRAGPLTAPPDCGIRTRVATPRPISANTANAA